MSDYREQGELEFTVSPAEKQESIEEFILTPSPVEKQLESFDLTLEADGIIKFEEISFDGEAEAEARIAEAMEAYSKAMDDAADVEY